ncbi:MAG TPA: CU044_2847 family protein [Natronosporangium sp.]
MAATQIVTYRVDDETTVDIEIDPVDEYVQAGVGDVIGQVRDATESAVKAARVVLEQARELAPESVQVKFGIKVSGKVDWLVAKAATEGNFEVTLSWRPGTGGAA